MDCGLILEASDHVRLYQKKDFTCQTNEFTTSLLLLQVVLNKTYIYDMIINVTASLN